MAERHTWTHLGCASLAAVFASLSAEAHARRNEQVRTITTPCSELFPRELLQPVALTRRLSLLSKHCSVVSCDVTGILYTSSVVFNVSIE